MVEHYPGKYIIDIGYLAYEKNLWKERKMRGKDENSSDSWTKS